MKEIQLQILNQSYWMHFNEAKFLALYYSPEHPQMKLLAKTIEDLRIEIEKIKIT
jgi:hypothetical protein